MRTATDNQNSEILVSRHQKALRPVLTNRTKKQNHQSIQLRDLLRGSARLYHHNKSFHTSKITASANRQRRFSCAFFAGECYAQRIT